VTAAGAPSAPAIDDLSLADHALRHVAGDAQVTITRERSLTSRFARSTATQVTSVEDVEVEFLCVVDGHTAAASTNSLHDDELAATAARARAAAEAAARLDKRPGGYPGLPEPSPLVASRRFDAATARLDPGDAGAALSAAFAQASAHGLEAFGIWTGGVVGTAIATTGGIRAADAVTDAHMRVICRDVDGHSGFASQTAVAAAAIDGATLAGRAAAKVDVRDPVDLAPGEYTVVLAPEAVDTLLDFLGRLAFNGLAHAEGRGALSGRLGSQVAAPAVNLSDSPRYPGTLPRAFDAEGVAKSPLPLIQDGVAHAVVHDTRSAARAGAHARSTGHALLAGGAPEGPMPTNLVLVGGGCADEAELMAPVQRGLYVTRLWYVNAVRERETLLTGTTRDGTFMIEDGRLTLPVRDVRFTDSALRILAATEALSAKPRLCTEADLYGRRFAYGSMCPALRAHGFRVTGATVA
jgi:predicted Zn-dependent protease